jgi:hypothetical protein
MNGDVFFEEAVMNLAVSPVAERISQPPATVRGLTKEKGLEDR